MGSNAEVAEWGGDEVRHSEDSFPREASAMRTSPHRHHAGFFRFPSPGQPSCCP